MVVDVDCDEFVGSIVGVILVDGSKVDCEEFTSSNIAGVDLGGGRIIVVDVELDLISSIFMGIEFPSSTKIHAVNSKKETTWGVAKKRISLRLV